MATTTQTAECPRCSGNGYIQAFAHVEAGICFKCRGIGTVEIAKAQAKLSADTRKKAEWILNTDASVFSKLSYAKLLAIRNFAHGGWGITEAYPELLGHWRKEGESAFQAKQAEKLAGN